MQSRGTLNAIGKQITSDLTGFPFILTVNGKSPLADRVAELSTYRLEQSVIADSCFITYNNLLLLLSLITKIKRRVDIMLISFNTVELFSKFNKLLKEVNELFLKISLTFIFFPQNVFNLIVPIPPIKSIIYFVFCL